MRIFWIEDGAAQKEAYFPPDIIDKHEICKKGKKFEDIVNVIKTNEIVKYDFFVIDLDLRKSDIEKSDSAKLFMTKLKIDSQDHKQRDKFVKQAGYHLAVELICRKGFPLERVVFLTGYAEALGEFAKAIEDSIVRIREGKFEEAKDILREREKKHNFSKKEVKKIADYIKKNQWEEVVSELNKIHDGDKPTNIKDKKDLIYPDLKKKFNDAGIEMPEAIPKSEAGKREFSSWFNRILEPSDEKGVNYLNFLMLRRGILDVLDKLKYTDLDIKLIDKDTPILNKENFITTLEYFFKAHELSKFDGDNERKEVEKQFYLTVCDQLTKIFDVYEYHKLIGHSEEEDWYEKRSAIFPAYFLRNWIAHGLLFGGKSTQLDARDTAFIFLIVVKGIFQIKAGKIVVNSNNDNEQIEPYEYFGPLFGRVKTNTEDILKVLSEIHNKKYSEPKYMTNKLDVIRLRGDKRKNNDWEEQDFLYHLYASYLFASVNQWVKAYPRREKKFCVEIDYYLENTSMMEIAFKRLLDVENNKNPIYYRPNK